MTSYKHREDTGVSAESGNHSEVCPRLEHSSAMRINLSFGAHDFRSICQVVFVGRFFMYKVQLFRYMRVDRDV
jgi:hypothetical protein